MSDKKFTYNQMMNIFAFSTIIRSGELEYSPYYIKEKWNTYIGCPIESVSVNYKNNPFSKEKTISEYFETWVISDKEKDSFICILTFLNTFYITIEQLMVDFRTYTGVTEVNKTFNKSGIHPLLYEQMENWLEREVNKPYVRELKIEEVIK